MSPTWTGSPCPLDPDNWWQDDTTGERVSAPDGAIRRPYTKAELRLLENPPASWTECGCCGGWHPTDYQGDCRNDEKRWPS